ncbi:retropepsin-like aspartic protease [Gluconacetobacter tumulisoli]|uniref:Uncharacterized protein n=1 Tax=Gluconacetobacter tumulisoli TaxID=1286189 RepID=A0A7W4PPY6_9PROT|nr:retropepsin-like aspartic protease [Gluconacetobacter tumulisoli]MBB2202316.1 hypothetical protein [Gluconacetobacter tumulisoli]
MWTVRMIGWASGCVAACLFFRLPAASAQAPAGACIKGVEILPLLGGEGDAPVIPVTIDGERAALYFSPVFSHTFLHDGKPDRLWFPRGGELQLRGQDGSLTTVFHSRVDDLKFGNIDAGAHDILLLDGDARHRVGDRPVLGIVGRPLLTHVSVLLDVPHRRLALFEWGGPGCGSPAALFQSVPEGENMGPDAPALSVSIDGHAVRMRLDPDLSTSVLPTDVAHAIGVTDVALEADPRTRTKYVGVSLGRLHRFAAVDIGGASFANMTLNVQDRIDTGTLGGDFFRRVVALFDFPRHRFYFEPTSDRAGTPSLGLHFDETEDASEDAREADGTLLATRGRRGGGVASGP